MKLTIISLLLAWSASILPVESVYTIDVTKSKVNWTGYYLFSFGEHFGSIGIQDGSLKVVDQTLVSGKIVIDMKSIRTLDKGFEDKDGLGEHLKSADFFEVDKYPTAILEITSVKPIADAPADQPNVEVVGMLTLKGIKHEITIPTLLTITDEQLSAKAKFKIDRTKWNVKYNSGKYFDDIGDGAISDAIGVAFDVIAKTPIQKR
ncbi:YceI family protein [Pseudochryseolinea flava]|uniref:YceI family protein n=1 Tax=Pseudochryseolinea flava TaxID=2059302 RepID=A0A364XYW7_9BACT|nr:YceI family protein [Pseudochryseolinea flava]RAV99721.1 YceI family protein [Pseudochryseolinea flava]